MERECPGPSRLRRKGYTVHFSLQKNVNAEVLAAKTNDIKHYVSAFVTGLTAMRTAVIDILSLGVYRKAESRQAGAVLFAKS